MLRLTLFGHFQATLDNEPLSFPTQSVSALVAYLVLEQRVPQPRAHVAALLWPDSTDAHGRRNLRQTLLRLRQTVPDTPNGDPFILTFQDPANGNGSTTPGSGGKIKGHRLKFDDTDTQQGVFFVAEDGTTVRVNQILSNKPGEVIFIVPTLTAGSYQLEVRVLFGKQLRRGLLEKAVTIV
ncbi:MAG: DUF4469 domain-containing protein [Candidatus Promineifilaceae bacterium]